MGKYSKYVDFIKNKSSTISHLFNDHIKYTVLPNGITLVSQPRLISKKFEFSITIKVGSFDDPKEKLGLAHFLEHTFFDADRQAELDKRNGYISFSTSATRTNINGSILNIASNREFILQTINAILTDNVNERAIETERTRIHNEISLYNDLPPTYTIGLASDVNEGGKSWASIMGTHNTLDNITTEDLSQFKSSWYRGSNIIMAFTGVNNHSALHEQCLRIMSNISPLPLPARYKPEFSGVDNRENSSRVRQLYFATLFDVPPAPSRFDYYVGELAGLYLDKAVIKNIVCKSGIVYAAGATHISDPERAGRLSVTGSILPSLGDKILPEIADVFTRAAFDPEREEMFSAKFHVTYDMENKKKMLPFIPFSAIEMAAQIYHMRDIKTLLENEKELEKVCPQDIQSYIERMIYAKKPTILAYGDSSKMQSLSDFVKMLEERRRNYVQRPVSFAQIPQESFNLEL